MDLRSIGAVDHPQAAVQVGAYLEYANHVQPLHAGCDTTGRGAHFRHDQCQLVAQLQTEAPGGHQADDDAELTRFQRIQTAPDEAITDDGNIRLSLRIDTADLYRLHAALE